MPTLVALIIVEQQHWWLDSWNVLDS